MKQDKDAFFSHSTRSLRAIRHEKEIISIQIGKEGVKKIISVFRWHMMNKYRMTHPCFKLF